MGKERLFTFGCSTTNYYWPTWADIIGYDKDYQNWGISGIGNVGIFLQLIEAGYKNNIGPNDTVIIMWTHLGREDRYVKDQWIARGNPIREYGEDFIKKYYCEKGSLIKELGCIASAIHTLNDWGCNWKFLTVADILGLTVCNGDDYSEINDLVDALCWIKSDDENKEYLETKNIDSKVIETYKNVFRSMTQPSLVNFLLNKYNALVPVKLNYDDIHPTPLVYYEFVKLVLPEFVIDDKCIKWINDWETKVVNSNTTKELKSLYQPNRF